MKLLNEYYLTVTPITKKGNCLTVHLLFTLEKNSKELLGNSILIISKVL